MHAVMFSCVFPSPALPTSTPTGRSCLVGTPSVIPAVRSPLLPSPPILPLLAPLCRQVKEELELRRQRTQSALSQMDEASRVAMEGHPVGSYVRLLFRNLPAEFMIHFDPSVPVLVGAVQPSEEALGYMKVSGS